MLGWLRLCLCSSLAELCLALSLKQYASIRETDARAVILFVAFQFCGGIFHLLDFTLYSEEKNSGGNIFT